MDNLEEMDKFLEKYNLPKLSEVKVSQSCPTVTPWTVGLPGSSIHGVLQARILEWVARSSFRDLPSPGIKPRSPALQANLYHLSHQGSPNQEEIEYLNRPITTTEIETVIKKSSNKQTPRTRWLHR